MKEERKIELEKYLMENIWTGHSKERLEKEIGYDVTEELNELMETGRVEEIEVTGDIFYKLTPVKVIRRGVIIVDEQLMENGILEMERIKWKQ